MRPLRDYSIIRIVLFIVASGLFAGIAIAIVESTAGFASSPLWRYLVRGALVLAPLTTLVLLRLARRDRWLLRHAMRGRA